MKKVLCILTLLCAVCTGAWADNIRPTYVSSNTTKGANDGEHASKLVDATGRTTKWGEGFTNGETTLWIIVRADNAVLKSYTLTNGNDTHSYPGRRWASWTVEGSNSSDENGSWSTIDSQTDATVNYATQYASTTFDTSSNNTAYSYYKITLTKINGEGANATMQQMGDLMFNVEYNNTVTATYNYKYNNVTKHSETVTLVPGNAFTDPATAWTNMPYGLTAAAPAGTVPETPATSYDIELSTENYPFQFSDSYATARWTAFRVRPDNDGTRGRLYLKYNAGDENNVKGTKTKYEESNADAYSWAFVGNPFDGFTVYNKAAGESMVWSTTSAPRVMKSADESKWKLVAPWNDASSANYNTLNCFSIAPQAGGDANNVNNSLVISPWSGNDQGSAFWVEPILTSGHKFVARNVGQNRYAYFSSSSSSLKNDANRDQSGKQYLILYPHAEGGYYIYNATANRMVGKTQGSNTATPTVDSENSSDAGRYTFTQVTSNSQCTSYFSIYCENHTWDADKGYWHINNSVANGQIIPWQAGSASNTSSEWIIEDEGMATVEEMNALQAFLEAIPVKIDVTINYTAGNNTWSVQKQIADGHTLAESDYAVDFHNNYSVSPSTLVVSSTNNTFSVTCNEDFPFEIGKYYRIQSKGTNTDWYDAEGTPKYYVSGATIGANTNLWAFEYVPNTENLFTVKNFATGKYLTFQGQNRTAASLETEVVNNGNVTSYVRLRKSTNGTDGFIMNHPADDSKACLGPHINETGEGNKVGSWAGGDYISNASNCLRVFAPESFTATLNAVPGDGYYGTIYSDQDMNMPEGIKAYRATLNNNALHLDEVEGQIPAGAYVLYKSDESAASDNITAAISMTTATESQLDNVLTGTLIEGKVFESEVRYALSGKYGIGFYKYTPATYPVAKAVYIPEDTVTPVAAFYFDFGNGEQTTGIEQMIEQISELNNQNATILDLQGRRIEKAQKGMNIINGRKVLR